MKLIRVHCHTDIEEKITTCQLEIHPELLEIYQDLGIIKVEENYISENDWHRLQKILRLKRNCGVNTIGATIIVDLLEKIDQMQDEIDRLRRK